MKRKRKKRDKEEIYVDVRPILIFLNGNILGLAFLIFPFVLFTFKRITHKNTLQGSNLAERSIILSIIISLKVNVLGSLFLLFSSFFYFQENHTRKTRPRY